MDNPTRHLVEWLSTFTGNPLGNPEQVASELEEFMYRRGWRFAGIPADERYRDAAQGR